MVIGFTIMWLALTESHMHETTAVADPGGGGQEARAPYFGQAKPISFNFRPQTAVPSDLPPPLQTGAPIQFGAPYPLCKNPGSATASQTIVHT